MPLNNEDLINYRISRALETIDEAKISIENNHLFNAENRIYYSIFYAVTTLAIKNNFSTSKHRQLLSWFNKNFVKTGNVELNLWKIYKNSFNNRLKGDYEDFKIFKIEQVKLDFSDMKIFVDYIIKLVKVNQS